MENTNNKFISFFKKNYQSIIWTVLFGLVLVSLVYAVVFMSSMWTFSASGYIVSGNFGSDRNTAYVDANNANNTIFVSTVILIILLAVSFLIGNRKRAKYYKSNVVFGIVTAVAAITLSIICMVVCGNLMDNISLTSHGNIINAAGVETELPKISILIPNGFKEAIDISAVNGLTDFSHPKLGDPDFTIEGCYAMVRFSFVLYSIIIVTGIAALIVTIKKLIDSKKTNNNVKVVSEEEM